jgi:hypothetical protein
MFRGGMCYEAQTFLGLGVSRFLTRVGVQHGTCDYIELCHFLKLLLALSCQCRVWCLCFIGYLGDGCFALIIKALMIIYSFITVLLLKFAFWFQVNMFLLTLQRQS